MFYLDIHFGDFRMIIDVYRIRNDPMVIKFIYSCNISEFISNKESDILFNVGKIKNFSTWLQNIMFERFEPCGEIILSA